VAVDKPAEDTARLMHLLKDNALFSHLEEPELKVAVDAMFHSEFLKVTHTYLWQIIT
jgi:hypothetical protein